MPEATGTIAVWEIGMDVIVLGLGTRSSGCSWPMAPRHAVGDELSYSARTYAVAGIAMAAGGHGSVPGGS